jgi:hypothetical protein
VSHGAQLAVVSLLSIVVLGGCRSGVPQTGSEALALITRYDQKGQYDDAIRVAEDWLEKHPDDNDGTFYEQIALAYLIKASKQSPHEDEWITQAASNYDKVLSVHRKNAVDVELYIVGRGFELAGDLSTNDGCLYYRRAIDSYDEEIPFIQADSYTAYGKTIPLAPVRQENEKALERVKAKFADAHCK